MKYVSSIKQTIGQLYYRIIAYFPKSLGGKKHRTFVFFHLDLTTLWLSPWMKALVFVALKSYCLMKSWIFYTFWVVIYFKANLTGPCLGPNIEFWYSDWIFGNLDQRWLFTSSSQLKKIKHLCVLVHVTYSVNLQRSAASVFADCLDRLWHKWWLCRFCCVTF